MQSVVITNFFPDEAFNKRFPLHSVDEKLYRCESSERVVRGSFLQSYFKKGRFIGIRPKDFKPEAVFFDMDSTLIEEESGVVLSEVLGIQEDMKLMTEVAMAGKIGFAESFRMRLLLLKGLSLQTIVETFSELHLHKGVSELCDWLKGQGVPFFIISGGFSFFCEHVAQVIGADDWQANRVDLKDDKLTGEISSELVDRPAKRVWIEKICKEKGINPANIVMVGDGANDRDAMEASGLAVGFQAKEVLFPLIHAYNGTDSHESLIRFLE